VSLDDRFGILARRQAKRCSDLLSGARVDFLLFFKVAHYPI